jgi:hypothetical protein
LTAYGGLHPVATMLEKLVVASALILKATVKWRMGLIGRVVYSPLSVSED